MVHGKKETLDTVHGLVSGNDHFKEALFNRGSGTVLPRNEGNCPPAFTGIIQRFLEYSRVCRRKLSLYDSFPGSAWYAVGTRFLSELDSGSRVHLFPETPHS